MRRENADLRGENALQKQRINELLRRIQELEGRLRRNKRQAAPFARDRVAAERRKPGQSAGHSPAWQQVPEKVDREVFEPLVDCPACAGQVSKVEDVEQYVVDLPEIRPLVTRVVTQRGWCPHCRRRVRSVHSAQASRAGGAAKVSLGPRALGLASDLKHRMGVPYRKIQDLFRQYFHLPKSHGALVQSSQRLAKAAEPSYQELVKAVRSSPVVHTDDTGWRIDTRSAWLWVFATSQVTLYVIARGRGADVVTSTLGGNFPGCLVSDGLPALDSLLFTRAQCLGHLIRRASLMEEEQTRGAVRFPRAVKHLLQSVTKLAHRHGELAISTLAAHRRRLTRELDRLLAARIDHPENLKLWNHLLVHREQLLVCLQRPDVPPTNNLAEQELRGAVITRKVGGCNRSDAHARHHAVLASLAQTAHRHHARFTDLVAHWLCPTTGPPGTQPPAAFLERIATLKPSA